MSDSPHALEALAAAVTALETAAAELVLAASLSELPAASADAAVVASAVERESMVVRALLKRTA